MSNYRDINKLSEEDFFLEQYHIILKELHDIVNTNSLIDIKLYELLTVDRLKHFLERKKRLLKERKDIK